MLVSATFPSRLTDFVAGSGSKDLPLKFFFNNSSYFFQKADFFRVKVIYFVVRICDK